MKVSYNEGLAIYVVPRVMAVSPRGVVASVDRGRYGLSIEPRNAFFRDAENLVLYRRQHCTARPWRAFCKSRAVGDLMHVLKLVARNPGDLIVGLGLSPRSVWS